MDQKNLYVLGEATEKTGLGEAINTFYHLNLLYGLLCCFPREVFQTQPKIHDGAILRNS